MTSPAVPSPATAPAPFDFRRTRLRGVNLGGWFSQIDDLYSKDPDRNPGLHAHLRTFLGPLDFAQIRGWGFNHVRLPVDYYNVFHRETLAPDDTALAILGQTLALATTLGLGVILDLHRCPGHDFFSGTQREQAFFSDPSCRRAALRVWATLAERFSDNPLVALEILNEPVAPDAATWNAVKDEFCVHLRRHAPRSTLVVGSNRWNSATEFAALTPVADDDILYSFHCYTPLLFTHQRAPWIADYPPVREIRSWPADFGADPGLPTRLHFEYGRWDRERLRAALAAPIAFRERHGVPVACNEFGVYAPAPLDDRLRYLGDLTQIFREADIGWSYWNYKNLDFGLVSLGEKLHESLPQYANPARLDSAALALLQAS